jgi:hypothetical protein
MEIFTIGDVLELDPFLFFSFAGVALGAVVPSARRTVPAAGEVQLH